MMNVIVYVFSFWIITPTALVQSEAKLFVFVEWELWRDVPPL